MKATFSRLGLAKYFTALIIAVFATATVFAVAAEKNDDVEIVEKSVEMGEQLEIVLSVKGSGPIFFQWYKDNDILEGENAAVLVIDNVNLNHTGNYYCIASNKCGQDQSNIYKVNVEMPAFSKSKVERTAMAGDYFLWQSQPNPTSDVAKIKYMLPKTTHVKLVLNNTLGEEIAVIYDGIAESGFHQIDVNAIDMNLNSGTYLYTIITPEFRDTKTMIIVK
jgi:hypothetical protein